MRYFVVVGEASGDMHASKLLKGIVKNDENADIKFWGGDRMAEVIGADRMLTHYKDGAFMGIWEVARNIKTVLGRISKCKKDILEFNPDVVILVDYAGFNLGIAKFAKAHNIKTFFYIAPKVWAWKESRVKKIKKYVDELFVIFPFEVEYFRKWGINAHYFGNPIMEEIELKKRSILSKEDFIKTNSLDSREIIALLAGSRKQEVEYNLPFMQSVALNFPQYQFVVAAVDWIDKSIYEEIISKEAKNLKVVYNKTYDTLLHSKAAIVTSGTATLETALLAVPEIVCYWCSPLTVLVGRILIKVKFISLVNIIMNREVVKELIYKDMNQKNAVEELNAILPGGSKLSKIQSDYHELQKSMGDSGASDLVANKMVSILKCHNR